MTMSLPRIVPEPLVRLSDVTCGVRRSPAGSEREIPLHEFVFVRRGVFRTHLSRRILTADPNHAVVIDGASVVRFSHPTDDGDRFTAIELYPEAAREILRRHRPRLSDRNAVHLPDGTYPTTAWMALQVQRLRLALRDRDELAQEELALDLVGEMLAERYSALGLSIPPERESVDRRVALVEDVKLLLAARIDQAISLSALAREVGRSPFHLARTFREVAGQPIHRYQLGLRLAVALDRLAQGETNLSALAFDLGFSSHSHFTRRFHRWFGAAPNRVRRWMAADFGAGRPGTMG